MAKPDFSGFGNNIIISVRQIGKDNFLKMWMKYSQENTPIEWKLLEFKNTPLFWDSDKKPKYPPIPRSSR